MSAQESADQEQPATTAGVELFSSQEPHIQDHAMEAPDSPPDLYSAHNHSNTPATTPSKSATQEKVNHGAPGSSWNSKKFQEEYDRACEGLVDKNWDGKTRYGDPLLQK
ncbi:uncharacterized protein Bfra_010176 [Botrytis fragariae]|uniref:Uncharacterized protein n=1 Tax=Botrytis fragariae TaxID=1964551 RepID=A0A8H6EFI8_9HELO|nr:uncharacterized protein Bfra_010176 [Botrytis fragariae]KAF5870030.1 hypothetical protein Bfra_010176 [Botrytis fragariae]